MLWLPDIFLCIGHETAAADGASLPPARCEATMLWHPLGT